MKVRASRRALALALIPLATLSGACKRKPVEVNDITPSVSFNRARAPLGSAIEVTYTWTTGPAFKPVKQDYKALAHFLALLEVPAQLGRAGIIHIAAQRVGSSSVARADAGIAETA